MKDKNIVDIKLGFDKIDEIIYTDFKDDGLLKKNLSIEKLEAIKTWLIIFKN